ncbi:EAL domain-containing protein [Vibrio sp. T187]|uniref:bifunctional diguanylate cyclase/phosphodiesterase n=1 Tax=Vibrio TaxID=662 RepID=UPI0010C96B63|nr:MULTISPECIES: EAL domain-containing protein [Vibrio]MBW3695073.1 EAL domain-containing protein [Vibrio sp. T187]
MKTDNEPFVFAQETNEPTPTIQQDPWIVLIVDDEQEIHRATRFAFKNFVYAARPITFLNAYSGEEAKEVLRNHSNIACIFLDVVMETEDAGLKLVSFIREELNNNDVRIILRTGQAGYAPEVEVIQQYDINDYKEKSELTRDALFTCLTTALRSYQQIQTIESSRKGLSMIIEASSTLLGVKAVTQFSIGILTQICGLLHIKPEGVVCIHNDLSDNNTLNVLAAAGTYTDYIGQPLVNLNKPDISSSVADVLSQRHSLYQEHHNFVYIPLSSMGEIVVFVNSQLPISNLDQQLLEIFSINIAAGFENAKMFEKIESLAYQDQLTHLPNKLVLLQHLGKLTQQAHQPFILILTDVDNFEDVNDGLGSAIGDKLIMQIAHILETFHASDPFVAHLGTDTFALTLPITRREEVPRLLVELRNQFSAPIMLEDNLIPVSISIGCRFCDNEEVSSETLLRNAGIALNHAKLHDNGQFCIFESSMDTSLQTRLQTIKDIHHAVNNQEFCLYYQPQVCMKSGHVVGVEALIRWQRSDGTMVSPIQFIPAAETSGLIVPIGYWVLQTAIDQHLEWKQAGLGQIRMAVNVSPRQLCEADFVDKVIHIVTQSGIEPSDLELEITETMAMTDPEHHIQKLVQLRNAGIKIAVDDFGTGYSSLSYLQKLPIDRLKIDGAFVRDIDTKKEDASIAAMIINMGHELNLYVIAECIETAAHQQILNDLGCDEAQGYLYAKPLPAAELSPLFRSLRDASVEPDATPPLLLMTQPH